MGGLSLWLPEPASQRSRKRKSPLKEGLRNASSDRRPRRPGSEMGKQVDLQHTPKCSEMVVKCGHSQISLVGSLDVLFRQLCSDMCVCAPELQDECGRETGQVQQSVEKLHCSSSCNQRGQQIHKVIHQCWAVPRQQLQRQDRERKQTACGSPT